MVASRISVAVALAVLAGAAFYFINGSNDDAVPEGLAMANGRVEATQVDISTKFPGTVEEVLVREGDIVEIGQPVANIDIAELDAQLARAKADIASAESLVAASEAEVVIAKSQLSLAEQELERTRTLLEKGGSSQGIFDIRVTERDVAVAAVTAAEATLVSRHRAVDAAQAVADEVSTRIEDAALVSPVFGRVLYRLAEPGEVLGTGGKVLTLVDHDDMYMEIFLPASVAHLVNVGSDARIKLDIWEFGIPAKVSYVSPEPQFTPKEVETPSEREKLVFRIKVRAEQDLVRHNIERVKSGLRGVAYVRLDGMEGPEWSSFLPDLPPEALPGGVVSSNGS